MKPISHAVSVESLLEELSTNAQLIFESLDKEGRGYLEAWQLAEACGQELSSEDADGILRQLDSDGDGIVSFEDFCRSFHQIVRRQSFFRNQYNMGSQNSLRGRLTSRSRSRINSTNSPHSEVHRPDIKKELTNSLSLSSDGDEIADNEAITQRGERSHISPGLSAVLRRLKVRERLRKLQRTEGTFRRQSSVSVSDLLEFTSEFDRLNCGTEFKKLHNSLSRGDSSLKNLFERIISTVLSEVHRLREENSRMEDSIVQERRRHQEEISRLAVELDQQILAAESVARQREREELQKEFKADLKAKNIAISRLTSGHDLCCCSSPELCMISKDQTLSSMSAPPSTEVKSLQENILMLKWQKASAEAYAHELKAQLALAKNQIISLKHCYEGNAHQLERHHSALQELLKEKGELATETSNLKEVNRRLYDLNDNLCAALDQVSPRNCYAASSHATDPQRGPIHPLFCDADCVHRVATPCAAGLLAEFELDSRVLGSIPAARPRTLTCLQATHPFREAGGNSRSNGSAYSLSPLSTSRCIENVARCQYYKDQDLTTADSGVCSLRDVAEIQSEAETDSIFRGEVCWAQADLQAHAESNFVETRTQPPAIFETTEVMLSSSNPCPGYAAEFGDPSSLSYAGMSKSQAPITSQDANSACGRRRTSRTERNLREKAVSSGPRRRQSRSHSTVQKSAKVLQDSNARIFRIMFAGDSDVGKSSFILRLCGESFNGTTSATVGLDVKTKLITVDNTPVVLQLWDTAGQERFRSIVASFYRKADGILLLYDCTAERSFTNVRNWISVIRENANSDVVLMLIGNKIDLRQSDSTFYQRSVSFDEGKKLAEEFDATFMETSATVGMNIDDCIVQLTRTLLLQAHKHTASEVLDLNSNAQKDVLGSSCCML
ncbi:hypothetical protein SprV_0200885900 [Sparganum proliferum]